MQKMRGIREVPCGYWRATRRVACERLGDRPHVGGDEGVGRQRIAIDVAANRDEVGVMPQLGIVVEAAPGADAVAAPATGKVCRVGGLGPAEEHVVVACLEAD